VGQPAGMALRELVTGSDACTPAEGGAGPSNAMASLADTLLGRSSKAQERLREVRSRVRGGALVPAGAPRCCCRGRPAGRRWPAELRPQWRPCARCGACLPRLLAGDRIPQRYWRVWSIQVCRLTCISCAVLCEEQALSRTVARRRLHHRASTRPRHLHSCCPRCGQAPETAAARAAAGHGGRGGALWPA